MALMKWIRRYMGWIAGVVVGGFIFWGIGTAVSLNAARPQSVGVMFGRKVSIAEYAEALGAVTRQAMLTQGEQFREKTSPSDLEEQAWERLLFLKEAKQKGIRVSDSEVIETLQKSPLFQRNGQLDRGLYETIVRYTLGTTPRNFEEEIRQSLMIGKRIDQVFGKLTVSPQELKEEFEKEASSIQISFLSLPDERTAREIAEVTRQDPNDLERIAKAWKLKLKTSDFFKRGSPLQDLGGRSLFEAVFPLEPGQVTGPISTSSGWLVVRLEKKEPPKEKDFEAAQADLEKRLLNGKRLQAYLTWYQELRNRAAPKREALPSSPPR